MAALLALLLAGDIDLSKTGIPWVKGLEAAVNRDKPVLLFQLLGDFDDTYC
jgi:hypothetical protein